MSLFKKRSTQQPGLKVEKDPAALDRGLRAIYLDAKGHVPNLETFERTSSWRVAWMFGSLGLACLLLAACIWSGWWFFAGRTPSSSSALELRVEGPTDVSLGEEQAYELVWENTESQLLRDVDIRLNTPSDFTITSLDPVPTNPQARSWNLGWIQPHTTGRIRVKGFFVGSLGEQTALQLLGTYRAGPTQTLSEKTKLQTVKYTGTVLAGNLLFPERMTAGEPVQIRYVVANLGKQPIDHLVARLIFPAGFIPAAPATGTQMDLTERSAIFSIGSLSPGSFYTGLLPGSFASGVNGDAMFQAETGRLGLEGELLVAARSEARVGISSGDLVVRLVVNGGDANRSLEPGEAIRATLAYENASDATLRDVRASFQLESLVNGRSATGTSLLNWFRLDDPRQGTSTTKARLQTLSYDKARIPVLAELSPRSRGTIEVSWPTLPVASGTRDAMIRLTAQVQGLVAQESQPRVVRSQPIILTYRTDADVAVEPRYFTEEGAPIGMGPLPPLVGKTTVYRVYWKVQKTLHALDEATVTAVLPQIGTWTGKTETSMGAIAYDETTRMVRWTIGKVADGTKEFEGWFEVALTPQSVDVGRFAALLGETSFQARDGRLQEVVRRTKPAVSTDVSNDEGAKGKGVVRKE